MRRPVLPDRAAPVGLAGLAAVARLFLLDLLLMALLLAGLGALILFGIELPQHALERLELGPALLAFILIGAPIGEEIVFRGWLSGRPGHILALAVLVTGAVLALGVAGALAKPTGMLAALALLVASASLALWFVWAFRQRPAWAWFQRNFPWFYFASALAFASIHLFNFDKGPAALLLPLTLPQFVLGLILGFVRVNHGLWAGILFHALHNTVFVGLVLAASSAA